jgi:hypothetical protein
VPLAFAALVQARRRDPRTLASLSLPLLALGALHLYLRWRVPGFDSVFASHAVFWTSPFEEPFSAIAALWRMGASWMGEFPLWAIWLNLAVYALAIAAGLRRSERDHRHLALWVAVIAIFHGALSGVMGALAIPRMMVLAWAPSVLILWRLAGPRLPQAAAAILCALLALAGFAQSRAIIAFVARTQAQGFLPGVIERMHEDEPRWIDFEDFRARQRRQRRSAAPALRD